MGIKEDIDLCAKAIIILADEQQYKEVAKRNKEIGERVLNWLDSPFCPLVDEEELEEV